MATHDATSGFHDIKPLPEFSPFPIIAASVAAALLALALLWYWWKRRPEKPIPAPLPLTAIEIARKQLKQLELLVRDHRITLRDFASQLSLTVRNYLEQTLQFPAAEQTVDEVSRRLPDAFRRSLPLQSPDRTSDFSAALRTLLRRLEELAFADDSTERFHLGGIEVTSSLEQAGLMINNLHELLRKEEERKRSVTEHSSGGPQ